MKTYSGYVRRLGEATVDMNTETKTYSLIEIDNQVITNVKVTRKLANFVSDCVSKNASLYLHGSTIVGCFVDGKTYYESEFATTGGKLLTIGIGVVAGFSAMMIVGLPLSMMKAPSGFAFLPFIAFAVGAVVGGKWAAKNLATPKEFAEWKAEGAIAL